MTEKCCNAARRIDRAGECGFFFAQRTSVELGHHRRTLALGTALNVERH